MKIVLLPLDERPCNYDFPRMLCADVVLPPREALGDKKTPATWEKVARFLREECTNADALLLSVDMLLYGGIVPSRLHHLTRKELKERLSIVRELKAASPQLKIYAFALIMRCPQYSSSDEEPDYYALCGKEIFETGKLFHLRQLGLVGEGEYRTRSAALSAVTGDYLSDYLLRREVNLSLLEEVVRMKEIDFLVIPQDDSAPYGYTALDRERIRSVAPNVPVYPGADEVGMTLLARAVNEAAGRRPSVRVRYASERGRRIIPLYEDRELEKSVLAQIEAAGCVCSEGRADLALYINVPSENMADVNGEAGAGYAERDLPAFSEEMKEALDLGERVLAADVAYCNGGDADWIGEMSKRFSLFRLSGYAGWNTSSNTLGTAIAQGVMRLHEGDVPALEAFLAERLYEDVGYCGHVRRLVCERELPALGLGYFHADGERGRAASIVKRELETYMSGLLPELTQRYAVGDCSLPWRRMFEVALTVLPRGADKEES